MGGHQNPGELVGTKTLHFYQVPGERATTLRTPAHTFNFKRDVGPQAPPRLTESKFAFEADPRQICLHLGLGSTAPSPQGRANRSTGDGLGEVIQIPSQTRRGRFFPACPCRPCRCSAGAQGSKGAWAGRSKRKGRTFLMPSTTVSSPPPRPCWRAPGCCASLPRRSCGTGPGPSPEPALLPCLPPLVPLLVPLLVRSFPPGACGSPVSRGPRGWGPGPVGAAAGGLTGGDEQVKRTPWECGAIPGGARGKG